MINHFRGDYYFLSNFYQSEVIYDGLSYLNNEAAFQSAKVLDKKLRVNFNYNGVSYDFRKLKPRDAKRLGRKLPLRSDWEEVKIQIMYEIVKIKFEMNPRLKRLLLETGDEVLVEDNTWNDRFWGVCNGEGENHLGKILMIVRKELR